MTPRVKRWCVVSVAAGLAGLVGCQKPRSDRCPPNNITVSPGPDFTVLRASFPRAEDLVWHDRMCTGVRLREGREPDSLPGGRVNVWIARGDVIGHVDRNPQGFYQASVRGTQPHGTRIVAELVGSPSVTGHRFHAWAEVPSAVTRVSPSAGFALRAGEGVDVHWTGGDSSHVSVVVMITAGPEDTAREGYILGCVAPRSPGRFMVPREALAARFIPAGADHVSVAVTADNRVTEDDYALDVTPIGAGDDLVRGTYAR